MTSMSLRSLNQVFENTEIGFTIAPAQNYRWHFLSYLRRSPHGQEFQGKFPSKANFTVIKSLILQEIVSSLSVGVIDTRIDGDGSNSVGEGYLSLIWTHE